MARGNIEQLIQDLKDLNAELRTYTGEPGKTTEDASNVQAERLASSIDRYIGSINFFATPQQVVAAGLANGGGSVTAANNLEITLQ